MGFDTPAQAQQPKRDRWGRYLLPHPDTGREEPWTRATTYASTVADTYGLTRWQMRMVAKGIGLRQDLYALAASASVDDKTTLDRVAEAAKEAAGSAAGANSGTALHTFTERVDRGEDIPIPPPWKADIDAYQHTLTRHQVTVHPQLIERITVLPELQVAGTMDRIVTIGEQHYIADVKTGKDLSYSWGEIAIQLALYAHARHMWTGNSWEATPNLDLEHALIMWLPIGQGRCDLFWVDIAAGWQMVDVCTTVRTWRTRKDLAVPYTSGIPAWMQARRNGWRTPPAGWLEQIQTATTVRQLEQVWRQASTAGAWTPALTAAAAERKKQLQTVS